MRAELPRVFERLREIGAPVVQYKVCSTFDSSPQTGSIGCAIEVGRKVFGARPVAVAPAAPLLERYVVFGNLFAAAEDGIHRIDRHPSMSAHPITPMDEGDLEVHLSRQTALRVAGVDLFALRGDSFQWPEDAEIALFDGLDPADLSRAAMRILEAREGTQTFVVGSSGFTYGLMDYWRAQGRLPQADGARGDAKVYDGRLVVMAGSCSPATERQIRMSLRMGFHGIRLNPAEWNGEAAGREAAAQLTGGQSVILYSALGAGDRIGIADQPGVASAMGRLLRQVLKESGVRRVVVAGGDTSSYAAQELGITALTFAAPLARGAPLCEAHGWPGGLEVVLKGGQIGPAEFFSDVRAWS
jgi:uncharacterized protein YgbK (DUF1537 family)